MNDMLVQVAKAIHSDWSDSRVWEDEAQTMRVFYLACAAAAIRAMRQPTNAMCNAGTRNLCIDWNLTADGRVAPELWQTMIDEAMK